MCKECRVIFFHNHESMLRGQRLGDFDSIFHARGRWLDCNRGRDVQRLPPLPDGSLLYLKRFHASRGLPPRKLAITEQERIQRFIGQGLPGPECVAMGWRLHQKPEAFLLFRSPSDVVPLDRFLRSSDPSGQAPAAARRKKLIVELAGVLGYMHARGIYMPDLLARHVMVLPDATFYFIDLAHLVFSRIRMQPALEDLARLSATLESAASSRSERLRFLRAYLEVRGMDTRSGRTIRCLLRKIDSGERKARKRRRFPESLALKPLLSDGCRAFVNVDFFDEIETIGLRDAQDFFSPAQGARLLRDIGSRKNYRIESAGSTFFLKAHRKGRSGRGESQGRREWNNHLRLIRMGLDVPVPVAWGEGSAFSFFMSKACEGLTGDDMVLKWKTLAPGKRKRLLKNLAVLVARLHACAFFHRDLYLCHIMVHDERLTLIDLQRLDDGPLLRRHRQVKDLAALLYSSMETPVQRTDRLRFFRHYMGGGCLTKKGKALARAVERKAEKISNREMRKHNQKETL